MFFYSHLHRPLFRVMAKIEITAAQLQLLAAACLLVSWKVRELAPVSALKIVKYTSCSVKVEELLVGGYII